MIAPRLLIGFFPLSVNQVFTACYLLMIEVLVFRENDTNVLLKLIPPDISHSFYDK